MKKFQILLPFILLFFSCSTTKTTENGSAVDDTQKAKERIENRDDFLRENGADFIAFGSNPSWVLSINKVDKTLEIEIHGKGKRIVSLESLEYIDIMNIKIDNSDLDLNMTSMEQTCIDNVSGEVMPLKVTLEIDGKTFSGCGKELRNANSTMKVIPAQLNDIWALEAVDGKDLDFSNKDLFRPMLELKISNLTAIGTTGCNNFQAKFILEGDKISFPPFMMTQMYCEGYENVFVKGITTTASYKLEELKLYFYDKDGKEVLRFKKVD